MNRFKWLTCCASAVLSAHVAAEVVAPLGPFLVNHYTFDNPAGGNVASTVELDLGIDTTGIQLLNGAPRAADGAWSGSQYSLQTGQKNVQSNDDWKAGIQFASSSASSLNGTRHVTGATVMGWFKPLGTVLDNPSPNTNTPAPGDFYNAFGLAGLLRGDENVAGTDGHAVRALLEVINGKVTAVGRRLDSQSAAGSRASLNSWDLDLPPNQWTHLSAAFDFDHGAISLYRNGQTLAASAASVSSWNLSAGVDFTSNSAAGGIKIAGSYPDNSQEFNPFNGRIDELMFFNKSLTASEVAAQFRLVNGVPGDFDSSGQVNASDIDLLYANRGAHPLYDLTGDGLADQQDVDFLVSSILGSTYGDADLDGDVDVGDLGVLATNWQAAGTWATGDFDGSGVVEVGDLGLLASNWQFGVAAPGSSLTDAMSLWAAVPEPALTMLAPLAIASRRTRSRRPADHSR